jgi:hypothetical protein
MDEMREARSTHESGRRERKMHEKLCLENLKERDYLEELSVCGSIILEWILKEYGGEVWRGLRWLSIGNSEGLL